MKSGNEIGERLGCALAIWPTAFDPDWIAPRISAASAVDPYATGAPVDVGAHLLPGDVALGSAQ
jgi:hypothetical protein